MAVKEARVDGRSYKKVVAPSNKGQQKVTHTTPVQECHVFMSETIQKSLQN
ncbi:hypothetical protein CCACVL1_09601 [Corchorus capsularis]|uniref:Uncharacterized protein n=1 Tax=Corchorus capsularis TaxID=210143 RepID=A0A1R3IV06_COCAP|nr:hypothetical protein CCACVL1_09601 [Corchorus capsularis]